MDLSFKKNWLCSFLEVTVRISSIITARPYFLNRLQLEPKNQTKTPLIPIPKTHNQNPELQKAWNFALQFALLAYWSFKTLAIYNTSFTLSLFSQSDCLVVFSWDKFFTLIPLKSLGNITAKAHSSQKGLVYRVIFKNSCSLHFSDLFLGAGFTASSTSNILLPNFKSLHYGHNHL